jgi:hypothetical protein
MLEEFGCTTSRLDDVDGCRLGHYHRFRVDWERLFPLRYSDRELVNVKAIYVSDTGGTVASRPRAAE